MKVAFLIGLACLFMVFTAISQPRGCATILPDVMQKAGLGYNGPGSKAFEDWLDGLQRVQFDDSTVYQIPVVVHVIHNGEPIGTGRNIPDSRVARQIQILNEDFRKMVGTPGFNTQLAGVDTKIQFVLTQRDPDGNPTNGVVRVQGSQAVWGIGDNTTLKGLSLWPESLYLNVWVCDIANNEIGYAQLPLCDAVPFNGSNANVLPDGVVIDYEVFGDNFLPNTRFPAYNRGRTATHEIGHFLGLIHIWGDASDCSGTDFCEDTPPQSGNSSRCQRGRFTCGSTNMIENYLDYSNDTCMNIFTKDQARRMRTVLVNCSRRLTLLTSPAAINYKSITRFNLDFFPNPAQNQIAISIPESMTGKLVSVVFTNVQGKAVFEDILMPKLGQQQFILSLQTLPKGIFTIKLSADAATPAIGKLLIY